MWLRRLWGAVRTNHEQLKICFALIFGIFAAAQYLEAKWETRTARAFDYLKRAQSGEVHVARREIDRIWLTGENLAVLVKNKEGAEQANDFVRIEGLRPQALDLAKNEKEHQKRVHTLRAFYKEVSVCGITRHCDRITICVAFFEEVQEFGELYVDYFKYWGELWGNDKLVDINDFIKICDDEDVFNFDSKYGIFKGTWLYIRGIFNF